MRFKKRAFALIWILLSATMFCGMFKCFESSSFSPVSTPVISKATNAPIDQNKLAAFLMMTAMLSVSMGIFFFMYSDELQMYIGNYKRTKEI